MDRNALARDAKDLIDRIAATPRAAGSEDESRARALCAGCLERSGFTVAEEEFTYSPFPGRWAVPLLGLLFLFWFVFVGSQVNSHPYGAVTSFIPFLLLLPGLGYMLARMIPGLRSGRATNLVAARGLEPRLWLIAHLDSKSQPVPMLGRIAGIIAVVVATPVMIAAGVFGRELNLPVFFWLAMTSVGAAGSLAMLLSVVGNRSRGAVDNASGVVAAMLTAATLPRDAAVAVLLTSAEELGLQGASAWIRGHASEGFRVINFDGVDDVGILTCMAKRTSPLAARLRAASLQAGYRVRFRRVLPGVMVDALAFDSAGSDAVTISRGNFSTLARIHTPRDEPGRLHGTGVAEAVEMVTNFIKREI